MTPEEMRRFIVATEMTEAQIMAETEGLTCTPNEILDFVVSFGCFPTKNECDLINWHTLDALRASIKKEMMQPWYFRLK